MKVPVLSLIHISIRRFRSADDLQYGLSAAASALCLSLIHIYTKMFASTFTLSMFTFGGGFVIVPLMKKKFVDELHWIDEEEMLDMVAIAQSSPGAIAVNGSIIIGYRLLGVPGALVNIVATVLPPLIILTIISYFYAAFRSSPIVSAVMRLSLIHI